MKCPWCGKENGKLRMVIYITKNEYHAARVCARCRKAYLRKLGAK